LRFREYRLVEMATEELSAMLFAAHSALASVEIRLEKPEALRGRASSAAVSVRRTRAEFLVERRELERGHAERFLATHEATLELVTLEPHAELAFADSRRLSWLTHGSLAGDCQAIPLGEVLPERGAFQASSDGASIFVCEATSSPLVSR
jgi:hypothetical protein